MGYNSNFQSIETWWFVTLLDNRVSIIQTGTEGLTASELEVLMNLFKLFKKDPAKKLRKEYHLKLEKALHAQRNGNIREYSFLTSEAEAVKERLDAVNAQSEGNGQ